MVLIQKRSGLVADSRSFVSRRWFWSDRSRSKSKVTCNGTKNVLTLCRPRKTGQRDAECVQKARFLLRLRHGSGDRMYRVEQGFHGFGLEVSQSGAKPSISPRTQDLKASIENEHHGQMYCTESAKEIKRGNKCLTLRQRTCGTE